MSVINTNIKSLVAQDSLNVNNRKLSTAMERLSTGSRINSAADDAAGLSIATRMDSQVRGLNMAIRNANDTISVVQTAEGAMTEVSDILQRMRELSVQATSDTNSATDRSFLQEEVSQLAAEIDRIASTTQFNSMNILDGSYQNKTFQIGANAGQTIGMSIGSMTASTLGVASSITNVGSSTSASATSSAAGVVGLKAEGVAAEQTGIRLSFNATDDYDFDIEDEVSGITVSFEAGADVDLSSEVSKQTFLDTLNDAIATSGVATQVVGTATLGTTDATDADSYDDFRFSISVDGATPTQSVDLRSRVLANSPADSAAVTATEMATAMQTELQSLYGDNITVTQATGVFTVADAEGRSIEITQGSGSGAIFGTDADNDGALAVDGTIKANLTATWSGNDLIVTNTAGGKTNISNYVATGGSRVMFDAVIDSQASQAVDPIALVAAAESSDALTFAAKVEATQLSINFSDRIGDGTNANYSFELTDGNGTVLADLTAGLDLHEDLSNATIVAAVETALGAALPLADDTIDANDFVVAFNGNTLTITNAEGRAMGIEEFDSTAGYATVTPNNELGASSVVASQSAVFSTGRIAVDTSMLSADVDITGATDTGKFILTVDGVAADTELDLTFDGTDNASGTALAAALEGAIQGAADAKIGATDALHDLSAVTVDWDADTGTLLVRDSFGRKIAISPDATNELPTAVLPNGGGSTVANNDLVVNQTSTVAQGDAYEATEVTMTLSQDVATFSFELNGVALASTTWDSTEAFSGSAFETSLNAMMSSLNAVHPTEVFEYSVSGSSVTFLQRDGGPLKLGAWDATGNLGVTASVTPKVGQGEAASLTYYAANAAASAEGTTATATAATLALSGNDMVSMSISDGTNVYALEATAVTIGDLSSTQDFASALNEALEGSSIKATMDTSGKVYLNDTAGGEVSLVAFNSLRGLSAQWSPQAGQGDAVSVSASYKGQAVAASSSSGTTSTSTSGTGSIAQISVATQSDAANALEVVDQALNYVNGERSKLGAIENRLTHTINNLSNVVTNTAASRSRIMDADYGQETAELARAQIIQQAATAMLAQANQSSQSVLSLLQ